MPRSLKTTRRSRSRLPRTQESHHTALRVPAQRKRNISGEDSLPHTVLSSFRTSFLLSKRRLVIAYQSRKEKSNIASPLYIFSFRLKARSSDLTCKRTSEDFILKISFEDLVKKNRGWTKNISEIFNYIFLHR